MWPPAHWLHQSAIEANADMTQHTRSPVQCRRPVNVRVHVHVHVMCDAGFHSTVADRLDLCRRQRPAAGEHVRVVGKRALDISVRPSH